MIANDSLVMRSVPDSTVVALDTVGLNADRLLANESIVGLCRHDFQSGSQQVASHNISAAKIECRNHRSNVVIGKDSSGGGSHTTLKLRQNLVVPSTERVGMT